ncbi:MULTISPECIES: hypothetical protein [Sphingomonas]|uniref:Uncharacterized protein n=1 Tax=Sphingomonas trueperi TaxID=53317 RepID=A0A7X6BE55_9SPHN|nr:MULTISPECIES: hypothetical protein [Sphingomonas]NJB98432.1 hypothetical protein [Sphingomonas trueperi]
MAISRCLLIGAALGTCVAFVAHATAPHHAKPVRPVMQVASLERITSDS